IVVGRDAPGGVEAGFEAAGQLAEVSAEAGPGVRVPGVTLGDLDRRGHQQPTTLHPLTLLTFSLREGKDSRAAHAALRVIPAAVRQADAGMVPRAPRPAQAPARRWRAAVPGPRC